MPDIKVLNEDDPLRSSAEKLIRDVYSYAYGAKIQSFPRNMIAYIDDKQEVLCAAGLRFDHDGFFSERYLDAPIEALLSHSTQRSISRTSIFEVSTLAGRAPRVGQTFIKKIVKLGDESGFEWSFFTLTRRLHGLVERLGLAPMHVARADPHRLADFELWGRYYECDPEVYAVANPLRADGDRRSTVGALHAIAV